MGHKTGFHAPNGGADFLGYRRNRAGMTEVVYDDGVSRRMVWRVSEKEVRDADLSAALGEAVGALRVVPALISELKKRAISIERISG